MTQKPNRMPAPAKILLAASLAVNLLVAGVVTGNYFSRDEMHRHPPRAAGAAGPNGADMALGPLGGAFSREDRAAMLAEVRKSGVDLGSLQSGARQNALDLIAALQADPWNPAQVRGILGTMRAEGQRRAELGEAVMIDHLSQMSTGDRRAYADRLNEMFERFMRRAPAQPAQ